MRHKLYRKDIETYEKDIILKRGTIQKKGNDIIIVTLILLSAKAYERRKPFCFKHTSLTFSRLSLEQNTYPPTLRQTYSMTNP